MSTFWARRKAAVEAEAKADEDAALQLEDEAREQALEELSDEEILSKLELPDPDTLGEGDNFKVFWNEAVPSRIRTRAMRRLWRVNPVLANIDGLVDYGEDFTDAALVVEGMETAYQVGKGMRAHVEEMARKALEAEQPTPVAAADEDTDDAEELAEDAADLVETEAPDPVAEDNINSQHEPYEFEAEEEEPPVVMGRMRFHFDKEPVS